MNNDMVIINLDRPRQIKFTHTALKTLTAMTDKKVDELDGYLDVTNFEVLEQVTYCGLIKDAKDNNEVLSIEQIPELLDEAPSQAHVWEKVVTAWRLTFGAPANLPEGNQEGPVGKPARERSTGKKASE